ncbi:hypothetical protein YC2023_047613 [Brassica napus]
MMLSDVSDVSSDDDKAGDVISVKSAGLSAASSGPSKSIGKTGVSAGLGIGAKDKSSVSSRE